MKSGNATSRSTSLTSRNAGNRGASNTGGSPSGLSHSSSPASPKRNERSTASGGGRGSGQRGTAQDTKRSVGRDRPAASRRGARS